MLKTYFKIALRNLGRNKFSSFINIGGLAVGMAVAILIGLWIYDEASFNKNFQNYSRIGQVWQFVKFETEKSSYHVLPIPLAEELRTKYPEFEHVGLSTRKPAVLATSDQKFKRTGRYVEADFIKMMTPEIISGKAGEWTDMHSILLSESLARVLFGDKDAIGQVIKINNEENVKVSAVYKDFPENSEFNEAYFLAPWDLYLANDKTAQASRDSWDSNDWQIYVQLKDGADFKSVSAKIKDIRMKKENPPAYKPEFFVHPMNKWHLYSDFKNGVNTGGAILFVWLFGIIGSFVLLLACINFMNLSTARSEKRAKEVGIRKTIGSQRKQLIMQFLSESLLAALFAFVLGVMLVALSLPFFNDLSAKSMKIPWTNLWFWLTSLGFVLVTGLVAGSYPAIYLSSFRPIKVLKGTFKAGRLATIPRKALVVLQFTVSVILIIGTIVVFRQVQYAKNRPVGYDRNSLIEINMNTPALRKHYEALRSDLLGTRAVAEMSASFGNITEQGGGVTNVSWKGKDENLRPLFMSTNITHEYGKTTGWQLKTGRDFSRDFATDSVSMILNETAAKLMGFKNPVDELVTFNKKDYRIIGVINDMVKESPFEPIKPTFYLLNYRGVNVFNIRLSKEAGISNAISQVKTVFNKYDPQSPFEFKFVDEEYGKKFASEERVGKLAAFFAVLAIFISCLGLFGLASFVAEQRTKEIGVRKVLGASVFQIWRLLSREFMTLVIISSLIAIPTARYFMHGWLQNYQYRAELSWWIFAAASLGAIVLTLFTVSFQSIKGAVANPVKSLRTE